MTEYLFLIAIDADRGGDEKKEVDACEKLELKNVANLASINY
jgi:hypothetical protein